MTYRNLSPGIILFENIITNDVSDYIIKSFEHEKKNNSNSVFKSLVLQKNGQEVSNNNQLVAETWKGITSTGKYKNLDSIMFNSLASCLKIYNNEYENISNIGNMSDSGYLLKKYSPGGFFNWHDDTGPSKIRTLSIIWYLNDNFVGGELEFKYLNIKIKPKKNSMIIFPSHFVFTHRGNLVEQGNKYIITTFLS